MRRAWIAASALLAVLASVAASGCGPNPKELEPGLRTMLRDLAKAVVVNDKPTIQSYIIVDAGMRLSPMAAKDGDTPEGRERLHEANRKWIRGCFRDAGIQAEGDIEAFMGALRMSIDGVNAWVTFEIAAEGRRVAEVVTFRLTRTEKGWRMFEYGRQMKGMR
jgi:hypothetical protein